MFYPLNQVPVLKVEGHVGPSEPLDRDHPVVKKLDNWTTVNEELYNNIKLFDTARPLARGKQDTGKAIDDYVVVWTNQYGKGRVLAFAGDTTYRWRTLGLPEKQTGVEAHARFWKQTMLWLARQEEGEGFVWVKPDLRRLPAGSGLPQCRHFTEVAASFRRAPSG